MYISAEHEKSHFGMGSPGPASLGPEAFVGLGKQAGMRPRPRPRPRPPRRTPVSSLFTRHLCRLHFLLLAELGGVWWGWVGFQ